MFQPQLFTCFLILNEEFYIVDQILEFLRPSISNLTPEKGGAVTFFSCHLEFWIQPQLFQGLYLNAVCNYTATMCGKKYPFPVDFYSRMTTNLFWLGNFLGVWMNIIFTRLTFHGQFPCGGFISCDEKQ